MPTVASMIEHLQGYKPDEHIATAIWCEADVIGRAEQRGKAITTAQARNILDTIYRKQDCELGISWITVDVYIDELENPSP